jgi:hypothetical protein
MTSSYGSPPYYGPRPSGAPAHSASSPATDTTDAPASTQTKGIFLHTGWRSAGTWLWSRLRAQERVCAFYEPLSPLLSELRVADIAAVQPVLTSGHPPLRAPYYDEYRALMQDGARGVHGYRKHFGLDRFSEQPDDAFPALQDYLRALCQHATQRNRLPVLKFCRSQGRVRWLRQAFPGVMHVGVLRNPASQFASGWLLKQEWNNPFFVAAPFRVLGLNQAEPVVREIIGLCGVRLPPGAPASHDAYAAACEQFARTVEGDNAYRAFVALWTLCTWRMLGHVDVMVDMDELGALPAAAPDVRAQLQAHAGVAPDLGDARNLVDEAMRHAKRMAGIDGRALRAVNFAAQTFLLSHLDDAQRAQPDMAAQVEKKRALADELCAQWRFQASA